MIKYVYLLTMTEAGLDFSPAWEANFKMVVIATDPLGARQIAGRAVCDEPPEVWTKARYSSISKLGPSTGRRKVGIVARENNAS